MALTIRMLGVPSVAQDGVAAGSPRGRKVWALLAYFLLTERPPTRRRLTELLFPESVDPMRALRWNLTELRSLLGPEAEVGGDPVVLTLPPDSVVDVRTLHSCPAAEAVNHPGLGMELLAGMEPVATPEFAMWLITARNHERTTAGRILRAAVEALLVDGDTAGAIDAAGRLVALEPFDEDAHALLVRSYVAAGDLISARRQVAECSAVFRQEFNDVPGHGLMEVLVGPPAVAAADATTSKVTITAFLEAGRSALKAGLADAGIDAFRTALRVARAAGDKGLELPAALAFGSALVHLGRGAYALGREILTVVAVDAERLAASRLLAAARCEIAWADMLEGSYRSAERHLRSARSSADAPEVSARADVLAGWMLGDESRYGEALRVLERSRSRSASAALPDLSAWAGVAAGRIHLLRQEAERASEVIDEACEIAAREGMRSFPATCAGSLALLRGDVYGARDIFEHAYAVAYQAGDAAVLAGSQRGLALVDLHRGDATSAMDRLVRARSWIVRAREYRWQAAWVLDALCGLAISERVPEADGWVDELGLISDGIGAHEFRARAHLHRYHLSGDGDALHKARAVAAEADNPYLDYLVDGDANPTEVAYA